MIQSWDHANAFCDYAFDALVHAGDFAALERVARDPRMAEYRDVLLKHAHRSLRRVAPMTCSEAIDWCKNLGRVVQSPDDLHQVALDRLDEIKDHIETGESNTRELFASADEKKFQPWLMNQLELRNKHEYTVHREEEGDRKKLPDLRLYHSTVANHPVSIEVKVAENWTGPQLEHALEDQLVRRYLRAAKSRHGILLLCSRGKRKKWQLGQKNRDLSGARTFLQRKADALVSNSSDIDGLDVVTIDFH